MSVTVFLFFWGNMAVNEESQTNQIVKCKGSHPLGVRNWKNIKGRYQLCEFFGHI